MLSRFNLVDSYQSIFIVDKYQSSAVEIILMRSNMKILKNISIDRDTDTLWRIVAEKFDDAYKWMGFVHRSYKVEEAPIVKNAPVAGRVCEFTTKPNGLKAVEKILSYSPNSKTFTFDVVPINAPKVFPVDKNTVTMTVSVLGKNQSKVTWSSNIELTGFGYLIYPFIKRGLSKNFGEILQDLKDYAEGEKQLASKREIKLA